MTEKPTGLYAALEVRSVRRIVENPDAWREMVMRFNTWPALLAERDEYRAAWEGDNAALADVLLREESLSAERDALAAKLAEKDATIEGLCARIHDGATRLAEEEADRSSLSAMFATQADELKAAEAKLVEWQASQHYAYVGRDGKTILARDLEDRAEAAEARVAELAAENDRLAGVLKSLPGMIKATTLDDGPERLSKDTLGAWVDGLTACEKVAQRAVDAALKGDKP